MDGPLTARCLCATGGAISSVRARRWIWNNHGAQSKRHVHPTCVNGPSLNFSTDGMSWGWRTRTFSLGFGDEAGGCDEGGLTSEGNMPNAAAIGPPSQCLQLIDDLHGPHLQHSPCRPPLLRVHASRCRASGVVRAGGGSWWRTGQGEGRVQPRLATYRAPPTHARTIIRARWQEWSAEG